MGNLAGNKVYDWKPEDYKVSATMEDYFANFIKTGNPNGKGLTAWKANKGSVTPKPKHQCGNQTGAGCHWQVPVPGSAVYQKVNYHYSRVYSGLRLCR